MASIQIQCEYTDGAVRCPYGAVQKCTGSWCHGGVYCVKHIQYLDSKYICDICIREKERVRKELTEAEARGAKAAAFVQSIYMLQEKSKIRQPRRMFLTSVVLVAVGLILALILVPLGVRFPQEGQPLISLSSILAYGDIGILVIAWIFEIIAWIWTLVIAAKRGQKEWILSLLLISGIALPLYLIFNPITAD